MTVGGRPYSPFAILKGPSLPLVQSEGPVRYVVVSGKQDDGLWGPIGAAWISQDGERGGFLVNPWAVWEGSEIVRGYHSALERGWSHLEIYDYWAGQVWPPGYVIDEERVAERLMLVHELIEAL